MCRRNRNTDTRPCFCETAAHRRRFCARRASGNMWKEKRMAVRWQEDGMAVEQLMAFTVTTDHARQGQVWEALQRSWNKGPFQIRQMLTERTVRASDRRALFVGLDAYEQAGGAVMRDLFEDDDGGWLKDVALLDSLVADKLKAGAEKIAAGGWKWVEVK